MQRDLPLQPPPPHDGVETALAHAEASAAFAPSPRHRRLLRHLVERLLAQDTGALKESVIAVEVFDRAATQFDPRNDTIVRVEMRRLRQRLAEYYRDEGRHAAWHITLPPGRYVPVLQVPGAPVAPAAVSLRARDLTERGEHFLRQPLQRQTLLAALDRFDAALADSPDWAPAHAGRGRAWFNLATGWHVDPAQGSLQAQAALARATGIEPTNAVALTLQAALQSQHQRDWPAALRTFKRALQVAPNDAFTHSAYGCHLIWHGEFDQAQQMLQRARALDPQYVNTRVHLVNLRIAERRYDDAQAELDAAADIANTPLVTMGLQAALHGYRGDTAAAVAGYRQVHAGAPEHPGATVALASALAHAGQHDEADALLAALADDGLLQQVSPYLRAIFETRCGHEAAAFLHLDECLRRCDPSALQIPGEPAFEVLHADARWQALLQALKQPLTEAGA